MVTKLKVILFYGGDNATEPRDQLLNWLRTPRVADILGKTIEARKVSDWSPNSGHSVFKRVQKAIDWADVALALITPDPRGENGAPNVIDEIGRWHGRKEGETLAVIRQKDVKAHSNISGLVYIGYQHDVVSECSEQLLQFLHPVHPEGVSNFTEPIFSQRVRYGDETLLDFTRHLQEWKIVHTKVQNFLFATEPIATTTNLLIRHQFEHHAYQLETDWFRYCEPKAIRIRRDFQSFQLIKCAEIDELVLLLEGPDSVVKIIQRLHVEDQNSLHQLRVTIANLVDLLKQMLTLADYHIMHLCEKLLESQEKYKP